MSIVISSIGLGSGLGLWSVRVRVRPLVRKRATQFLSYFHLFSVSSLFRQISQITRAQTDLCQFCKIKSALSLRARTYTGRSADPES